MFHSNATVLTHVIQGLVADRFLTHFFTVSRCFYSQAIGMRCAFCISVSSIFFQKTDGRLILLFTAISCGAPRIDGAQVGAQSSECQSDAECSLGMVCAQCEGSVAALKKCAPGCRSDDQCRQNYICQLGVECNSCPCAPGWCQPDPCRDIDGDGFAFTKDINVQCRLPKGDCNDANARVNPSAKEVCANGQDDNCDGKTDAADTAQCRRCATSQSQCSSRQHCSLNTTCFQGCCDACPLPSPTVCDAGLCALPGGIDATTSCALSQICAPCLTCPIKNEPVCGDNGSTYQNLCYAEAAGQKVLHSGPCTLWQNWPCVDNNDCRFGQGSCQKSKDAGVGRCMRKDYCVVNSDCVQNSMSTCLDGGAESMSCTRNTCVSNCG
jgi:hypothetical protein